MKVAGTHWADLTNPRGKRFVTTWRKLIERLSIPRVCAAKSDLPGVALATYRDDYRKLSGVEAVYAIGLDFDHLDALSVRTTRPEPGTVIEAPDWATLRRTFAASAAFVHTTYSSTLALPRLRVFLLLSRPVSAEEYRRVYGAIASTCEQGGFVVDRQASDPSRLWYLPAVREQGASFVFWTCDGPPIDVDAALASVPPPSVPPPPRPLTPRTSSGGPSAIDRAAKYLATIPGAIQGSGGSAHTFMVAQRMVRGFALSVDEAYTLLANDWNPRCQPPWSERDLRRKCEEAARQGRMAEGDLLERAR